MSKKLFQSDVLCYYDENGNYDENEIINPEGKFYFDAHYVVCHECEGEGSHFRRDLDENRLVESMIEDGDDEGVESYYNGRYDEVCRCCHGLRVVYDYVLPEWAKKIMYEFRQWERQEMAIRDAERRVGA